MLNNKDIKVQIQFENIKLEKIKTDFAHMFIHSYEVCLN